MKRILLLFLLSALLIVGYTGWKVAGPSVHVPPNTYFYIHTGSGYDTVINDLLKQQIVSSKFWLDQVAKKLNYPQKVRPGKYLIRNRMSMLDLIRMLKSGNQVPIDLVISRKIRVKDDLVNILGTKFEFDSVALLSFLSNDSLHEAYGLDSATYLTAILPDTYTYYWNSTPRTVFDKLYKESQKFWTEERRGKARDLGLTPEQVYTLASIVDEETTYPPDKSKIASVYLNRLAKGMPLQADPTAKFALKNFELTRIYRSHLEVVSPYNTYLNKGLPPGPICTVPKSTIDSVLNAPETDYIFFVADSDLSGKSVFTSSYKDHRVYAKAYSKALDSLEKRREEKKKQTQ